jgi:hypothetical protein
MRRSANADLTGDAILDEREQKKHSSRWAEGQITGSGRMVGVTGQSLLVCPLVVELV